MTGEPQVAPPVVVTVDEHGVATVALDRPARGNALGRELVEAFAVAIGRLRSDPAVRAVLVVGRGKHFCTGADLGGHLFGGSETPDTVALRAAVRGIYDPMLSLLDLDVPTVAAVHGAAVGGGLGLALACDLRIVAEDARLQANFVRLGIPPGMGVTHLLPRLVGPQCAAELLLSGRPVSGTEAVSLGLALRAVPAERLEEEAIALARSVAAGAPEAVRLTVAALRRTAHEARAAAEREAIAQAHCLATSDAREGVAAWTEKRAPRFTGR